MPTKGSASLTGHSSRISESALDPSGAPSTLRRLLLPLCTTAAHPGLAPVHCGTAGGQQGSCSWSWQHQDPDQLGRDAPGSPNLTAASGTVRWEDGWAVLLRAHSHQDSLRVGLPGERRVKA